MSPRRNVFALAIAAFVMCITIVCQGQPQTLLTRHTRDVVLNGQAPLIGRLPANQLMRIDLVLALRDPAGLKRFLQDVYDPASPSYRKFVTVKQFTARFGPSREEYDAVLRFAKEKGFVVTGGSRNAMDVQLTGSVAEIETTFHVTMRVYHDAIENRDFYAVDREPTVDLPFRLWHISGLDNYSMPRPALVRKSPGVRPDATTGSCPEQSFCGSDMRAAYYEGKKLTGKGQNIGLLEFAGFDIADVDTYYKNAKQKRTATVKGISVDGTSINCYYNQGCDDTVQTIDITQALGMAPDVTTVYMFVGSSETALLGAMSSYSPLPLNLSTSWYWSPPDPHMDDPYFMKMAAQGQSFFAAAGTAEQWQTGHPWPAESDYVIGVGGTELTTKGPGEGWASEVVMTGAGGGISPDHIPIPSWQLLKGVITKKNEGSKVYRNGPDVTANAGFSFYVCADQDGCTANQYGGTAFSSPMWAGYLALANQQAAANGGQPPGFINPTIYPLGLGKGYHADFHDITKGNNGYFPATKGYDLASGWGSPNKDGLINALAGNK